MLESSFLRGCRRRLSILRPWQFRPCISSACLPSRLDWEGKCHTLPGQRWPLRPGAQAWPISDRPLSSFANITVHGTCSLHLKCSRTHQYLSQGPPTAVTQTIPLSAPGACFGFGFDLLTSRQKALQSITDPWGRFIPPQESF